MRVKGLRTAGGSPGQGSLILLVVGLGVVFWIFDSAINVSAFGQGTFSEQLFRPAAERIWVRLFVTTYIFAGVYLMRYLFGRRRGAEVQLPGKSDHVRIIAEHALDFAYSLRLEPDGRLTCEWITDSD